MSRTTRNRYVWIFFCHWHTEEPDPRDSFLRGRDDKACSLLYADYVKQRGWDRDFYNGRVGRRSHKRSARRHSRRAASLNIAEEIRQL